MDHAAQVTFVLGVALLLALGRAGGELARLLKAPPVVGELLAGLLLGPTILGRIVPGGDAWLFPASGPPRIALDGLRLIAVQFIVLIAGLEIDIGVLRRLGRVALATGTGSLVFPFALGLGVAWFAPGLVGGAGGVPPLAFALFFATALAISALPVIARILLDLNLLKTDVGLIVMASAMLDDVVGWLVLPVVLGLAAKGDAGAGRVLATVAGTLGFTVALVVIARPALDRVLPWLQSRGPTLVLAPILALGLLGGVATEAIGTHAVIGAFLVGVVIRTEHLREQVHEIVHQFVTNVFAPIYFATVGLRVDFVASFSPSITLVVLLVACAGKLVGAGLGAILGGAPRPLALAVASGLNARGAIGIVLAELALGAGVIDRPLFTSIVFMALATSLAAGPLMRFFLAPGATRPTLRDLVADRIVLGFEAKDAHEAIAKLSELVAPATGLDARVIAEAASTRERSLPTGLGLGVAVPHARLPGLRVPVVALGVSHRGIDFDAPDGAPAHLVFLIATPEAAAAGELQILRDIAQSFADDARRARALAASTHEDVKSSLA